MAKEAVGDGIWSRLATIGADSFYLCMVGLVASAIWAAVDVRREK
jgi:hypothetical protein